MENFDVIVIGAGISGLSAAKFYLDVHPDCQLTILDRDHFVGGTWNARRCYSQFWTQWTVGTGEFSDTPMRRPPEEDIYYETFKSTHTRQYLEDYVKIHTYSGKTLHDRIKFGTTVISILKKDGGWDVSTRNVDDSTTTVFHCSKLMVASGLTSEPQMPVLPGKENFNGPIIHQGAFGSSSVLESPEIKTICVMGGGKSSADMVYAAVLAGKQVTWLLRATDTTGPGFFVSLKGAGPYKNAIQLSMTRLAESLAPSVLDDETRWRKFLHSSKMGLRFTSAFWAAADKQVRKEADFTNRENVGGFDCLNTHTPAFWANGAGGMLNHPDFFDVVAKNVKVYCDDIASLDAKVLRLQSGQEIPCDAILCGTGWVPSLQFFSYDQLVELGLPHTPSDQTIAEKKSWSELEAAADKEVCSRFPLLANPPPHYQRPNTKTPYRLYNLIAPLSDIDSTNDRSIVFIGHMVVGNHFRAVEPQSVWATAYLDKTVALPDAEQRRKEVALLTSWCKWRYLSSGQLGHFLVSDQIRYTDRLLRQVGLKSHHRKGRFRDLVKPCWQSEYRGLKNEYLAKYARQIPPPAGGVTKEVAAETMTVESKIMS